eukprot:scaffold7628_cov253-Ochromonas_danica.AAC.18
MVDQERTHSSSRPHGHGHSTTPLLTRSAFDEEFQDVFDDDRRHRASRNSTGGKEEFVGPRLDQPEEEDALIPTDKSDEDTKTLIIVFCSMVVIGLGNKIFNKLMTIPMYNYPNFLNLLTSFVYIPVCFAYIIPMARNGYIPAEQFEVPKRTFAIMGALDALAGIMQIFGSTYLPGPMIILLLQAAIPYVGALIVAAGIIIVLAPSLTGGGSIIWSIVLILSTVPMALSSVYKEIALGETELDAIYLNGWVAVFQFAFSLVLAVPSSLASDPPVPIPDLPANMWNGMKCYVGVNSLTCDDDDDCTADDCNPQAPMFVNIYLVFNQFYNLLIILILKYGSANLLYLALTLMVPLGNVAFTLPFMPQKQTLQPTDIIGLVVICAGLGCYRFAAKLVAMYWKKPEGSFEQVEGDNSLQADEDAKAFSALNPAGSEEHNPLGQRA